MLLWPDSEECVFRLVSACLKDVQMYYDKNMHASVNITAYKYVYFLNIFHKTHTGDLKV